MSEDIKIYHVETQEDYDDLMIKLEGQGYKWFSGDIPTIKPQYWDKQREDTAIVLNSFDEHHITRGSISWCKGFYSGAPVVKHKAKGVKQMEKVVVPQFVADWYEKHEKGRSIYGIIGLLNDLSKCDDEKMFTWKMNCEGRNNHKLSNAQEVIAKMHLFKDYEVEEEKKYYWRKKKEYLCAFEEQEELYLNVNKETGDMFFRDKSEIGDIQTSLTETELKQFVREEDLNKLERVEIDDVQ